MEARQAADTALSRSSTWDRIKRVRFVSDVATLDELETCLGEPQIYTAAAWPGAVTEIGAHALLFEIEQQLADDFAFLASYEKTKPRFSSVCRLCV